MPSLSFYIICSCNVLMLLSGLAYFRHCRMTRPPLGVFNMTDVLIAMLIIVLAHFLYVVLPLWVAVGLFALATFCALYYTLEPLLHARSLALLASGILIVADIGAAQIFGTKNNAFFLVNDLVILLVIIGVSNLWVQSGIKARDVVLFSMLLALFDFFATALSPLTFTLFARLQTAPLTPALAWMSNSAILGGGLGDFVLVTVFSLSLYKAFGRTAGVINTLFSLLVIASLLLVNQEWPGMIFLAPLMLVQYLFWHHRYPQERTMHSYFQQI
jgi:hypothetical protein